MADINATPVDSWRGTLQLARKYVVPLTRPGVDGIGFIVGASRQPESEIETTKLHANLAAAQAQQLAFEQLVGTIVSVTDALGVAHNDTLVLGLECSIQAITGASSDTAMLTCFWRMAASTVVTP